MIEVNCFVFMPYYIQLTRLRCVSIPVRLLDKNDVLAVEVMMVVMMTMVVMMIVVVMIDNQ